MEEFLEKNKKFWSFINNSSSEKSLLIEEPSRCFITHVLATQALVLCQAKSYKPVWIHSDKVSLGLLKSYDAAASYIKVSSSLLFLGVSFIKATFHYIKMVLNKKVLAFKYDGVKYGDIVYDSYLSIRKVGTVKNIDPAFLYLIYSCIKRHDAVKQIIKNNGIVAVLASHRIGIGSGVLIRVALRCGCEVYTSAGLHRSTLYRSKGLDEMVEYEYAPTKKDIEEIVNLNDAAFTKLYKKVQDFHIYGNCSMDAKYAFADPKNVYAKKESFNKDFNLDQNKKNIFVMLHAFTDHPHSHFKWMIFNDYADWFLKTLEYAKKRQ